MAEDVTGDVIDGADHWVAGQRPEELAARIQTFPPALLLIDRGLLSLPAWVGSLALVVLDDAGVGAVDEEPMTASTAGSRKVPVVSSSPPRRP